MQHEFGMTVLLTTHYMQEADALCDRVALMHHGQLQAVGSPAELKRMVSAQAHVAASAAQTHVAASAAPAATLEDVFRHYAGSDLGEDTSQTGLRAVRNSRRTARRVS
jgi:ABC-2 type transport system ATP-binding protein